MNNCPHCGAAGADILLQRVFCPNDSCQWFDELTKERLTAVILDELADSLFKTSDPDKTPVWHPGFIMRDPDDKNNP